MRSITRRGAGSLLLFFLMESVSPAAHADVGLPLIAALLPPMWIAFVPIVMIEAAVLCRLLAVPLSKTIFPALLSNVASTAVGVPITWIVLAVAELVCCGDAKGLSTFGGKLYAVTVQAPWLIPYEGSLWWMIPSALIVMAVPCFVISVLIEAPVNRLLLRATEVRLLWKATALANVCSYVVLGLLIWPSLKIAAHMQGLFGPVDEWFAEITFRIVGALTGHRI